MIGSCFVDAARPEAGFKGGAGEFPPVLFRPGGSRLNEKPKGDRHRRRVGSVPHGVSARQRVEVGPVGARGPRVVGRRVETGDQSGGKVGKPRVCFVQSSV